MASTITQLSSSTTNSTQSTVSSNASNITSSTASLTSTYSDFLKLLTTQLQYQDPLDPTDTSQFTNQLVLFSQVEQQIDTNTELNTLISLSGGSSTQQALGYLGKQVEIPGNSIVYSGTGGANFTYTLPSAATSATAYITDSSGNLVTALGVDTGAGTYQVNWDGTNSSGTAVAAGTYNVAVTAASSSGQSITATTNVFGTATGVDSSSGTTKLIVNGTEVPVSSVTSVSD